MLVSMKKSVVPIVLQVFNSFQKNLFTVDLFEGKKVHFLDLLMGRNTTDIYFIKYPYWSIYELQQLYAMEMDNIVS